MHLLARLIWVHLQTEMTDFSTLSYSSTGEITTLLYTRSLLLVGGAPRVSHSGSIPLGSKCLSDFFHVVPLKLKKVSESLIWMVSRVLIDALYRLKELKQRFADATPSCNVLREFL